MDTLTTGRPPVWRDSELRIAKAKLSVVKPSGQAMLDGPGCVPVPVHPAL